MNDLIVTVKLWDKEVGSLYWDNETNSALFDYERSFIRTGLDISPIIMSLKNYRGVPYQFLENRNNCFKGLPGLFADALPDAFGNQIINECITDFPKVISLIFAGKLICNYIS